MVEVKIKLVKDLEVPAEGTPLPEKAFPTDAGYDLRAWIVKPYVLKPMESAKISCGFKMELPAGYEAQIRPRSGLAAKHQLMVINSPGTIDETYRGIVSVLLFNLGKENFIIKPGMRIAQMVICPVVQSDVLEVDEITETPRSEGGFGSTGA